MMVWKIILLAAALLFEISESATWDYASNGPSTWGNDYADCNKESQSPIDIRADEATVDYDLPIIDRRLFYTPPTNMSISNNGHTITMSFNEGAYVISDPKVLPFDAKIAQYHFHWADTATGKGSEHTLDGKQYFGELHAVHYNTKYSDISAAIDQPDGLAVFGWFIDIKYPQTNQDMKHFLDVAESGAPNKDNNTFVNTLFSLETLLPPGLDTYYRYPGSLTTPGCYESVLWTVFEEPIQVTAEQATFLATMFYEDQGDTVLNNNFRPVQQLNGRVVKKSPALVQDSGAILVRPSLIAGMMTFVLALFL